MNYRELAPTSALQGLVRCYWTLEGDAHSEPEPIFPDGSPELVFHCGAPFARLAADASWQRQPRSFLAGQLTRPIQLQPARAAGVLGVRFHPWGAFPFLGFAQREGADCCIATGDLWGRAGRELEQRVLEAGSTGERVFAIERFLLGLLGQRESNPAVRAAVSAIFAGSGMVSLDQLTRAGGRGGRQLERLFAREVGVGPKMLARIVRFQRALRVYREEGAWIFAAIEAGYCDQPHLVRDFRQFAGAPPAASAAREYALARHFLLGHDGFFQDKAAAARVS